jgi:hypothetical protein
MRTMNFAAVGRKARKSPVCSGNGYCGGRKGYKRLFGLILEPECAWWVAVVFISSVVQWHAESREA